MSSINDFSSLSTAVANWMMRPGNTDFTGNVGDFIAFGEELMNFGSDDPEYQSPPLRVSEMEVAQTTFTILASSNTVNLPADFLGLRRFYLTGSPIQKLTYVTPNQMDSALANAPVGPPEFFTIMAGAIYLPAPVSTTQTLVGGYFRKIAPLSSSNTVNWAVEKIPSMYLAACLHKASLFVGDDDGAAKWFRMYSGAARSYQKQNRKAQHSGDALQIKTDTGNP